MYAASVLVQPVLPTPQLLDAQTCTPNIRYAQTPLFVPRIRLKLHVDLPDNLPEWITQTLQAKIAVKMVNLHNCPVFAIMKTPFIKISKEFFIGQDIDGFWQDPPIGRDQSNHSSDKILLIKQKSSQSTGIELTIQLNCDFNVLSTSVKILNMEGGALSHQDLWAQSSKGAVASRQVQSSQGAQD